MTTSLFWWRARRHLREIAGGCAAGLRVLGTAVIMVAVWVLLIALAATVLLAGAAAVHYGWTLVP
jgi:hypothetical protein